MEMLAICIDTDGREPNENVVVGYELDDQAAEVVRRIAESLKGVTNPIAYSVYSMTEDGDVKDIVYIKE